MPRPADVDTPEPDEKSLITYVSSLYDIFPEPPAQHPLYDAVSVPAASRDRPDGVSTGLTRTQTRAQTYIPRHTHRLAHTGTRADTQALEQTQTQTQLSEQQTQEILPKD